MKKLLFPLLAGAFLLSGGAALAQDKPVLNTTPPGTTPPPPSAPLPTQPAPAPAPAAPAPQPSADKPSGLDLPSNSDARVAGGGPSELASKLFIYSNFGLGYAKDAYGFGQFNISLAPALGYRFNERFAAGPGISYAYVNYTDPSGNYFGQGITQVKSNNLGVKAFAQLIVYEQFFIHAEYEVTQAVQTAYVKDTKVGEFKRIITSPLAGIGYRQSLSDRAAADIVVLYNFDNNIYSLYSNPVVRFSFLFNLGR